VEKTALGVIFCSLSNVGTMYLQSFSVKKSYVDARPITPINVKNLTVNTYQHIAIESMCWQVISLFWFLLF